MYMLVNILISNGLFQSKVSSRCNVFDEMFLSKVQIFLRRPKKSKKSSTEWKCFPHNIQTSNVFVTFFHEFRIYGFFSQFFFLFTYKTRWNSSIEIKKCVDNYSKVPNRRACSLRFFIFSFHPAHNFSCNKRKIPPCSFINLLST